MFSKMSIWMTMSRLFSGLIKLREKCNRYAQFPVYLQLKWQLQKKLHRHFQGLWCRPGRTADIQGVATWVPNYQTVKLDRIFAPFGIWHFITSTTHIICFWNPLKPPWNLSPFSRQANSSSHQNSNKSSQISSPAALGQRRWRAQGEGGGLDKGDGGSIQVLEYKETKEQK